MAVAGLPSGTDRANSGLVWQLIRFVIDNSWNVPQEQFHIKTRQGMKIEHYYSDGRHWIFNGGDSMLRIMSPDGNFRKAWIFQGGAALEYHSQWPSQYPNMHSILEAHS